MTRTIRSGLSPTGLSPTGLHPTGLSPIGLFLTVLSLIGLALALVGCSASGSADSDSATESNTTTTLVLGNPGTLVPPTTEPPLDVVADDLLPVTTLVAFLDACITNSGLLGPCHCAAERLDASFTIEDIQIFEDRITGQLEYPPQVAADLVSCQYAEPPESWGELLRLSYVEACAKGSDLLQEPCTCSLARAQDVIPADRLGEYLESTQVRPDFTALINLCL